MSIVNYQLSIYPVSLVKKIIHDGEVGHKPNAVLENLRVAEVGEWIPGLMTTFGMDGIAQVVNIFPLAVIGNKFTGALRLEVLPEEFQNDLHQL